MHPCVLWHLHYDVACKHDNMSSDGFVLGNSSVVGGGSGESGSSLRFLLNGPQIGGQIFA